MSGPVRERHERLGSTQDRLRALAAAGAPVGSRVRADEQTAGRGRGGKEWRSGRGSGLWMSVLLPGPAGGRPAGYPLAVGVRLALAIELRWGGRLALKWPNDLQDRPGGRKLGGILCESIAVGSSDGGPGRGVVVVGIGLNVTGAPDGATSLCAWAAEHGSEHVIEVDAVERCVVDALAQWIRPGAGPPTLDSVLHRALTERDGLRGRRVRLDSGVEGVAAGIDREGALLVRVERAGAVHTQRVWSGSVRATGRKVGRSVEGERPTTGAGS